MRFLVIFLACIALPVAAQETGLYMGAGLGGYTIDDFDIPDPIGFDPSIEGTSFGIYGGWQFIPYVGAELALTRLRKEDDTATIDGEGGPEQLRLELETDVLALTINPTLPMATPRRLWQGRLGLVPGRCQAERAGVHREREQ